MTKQVDAYMILKVNKDNLFTVYDSTLCNNEECDKKIEELAMSETFDLVKARIVYKTNLKTTVEKNSFTIQERVIDTDTKDDREHKSME